MNQVYVAFRSGYYEHGRWKIPSKAFENKDKALQWSQDGSNGFIVPSKLEDVKKIENLEIEY